MEYTTELFPSHPIDQIQNGQHDVLYAAYAVARMKYRRQDFDPGLPLERNSSISTRSSSSSASPKRSYQPSQLITNNTVPSAPYPTTPPPISRSQVLLSPPDTHRIASSSNSFRHSFFPHNCRAHARFYDIPRQNYELRTPIRPMHSIVGDLSLNIHRLRLPPYLLRLLDSIVLGCEAHAATLSKGWLTELYSLTKQDIALRDVPQLYHFAKPIVSYIKRAMANVYGFRALSLDRNQPHVLKYSAEKGHTGVELHHDKCDVTANLCMSRSATYVDGGTYFPDAREVIRLEFGEFLLHPGQIVHGGMNISSGTRFLMVIFANAIE